MCIVCVLCACACDDIPCIRFSAVAVYFSSVHGLVVVATRASKMEVQFRIYKMVVYTYYFLFYQMLSIHCHLTIVFILHTNTPISTHFSSHHGPFWDWACVFASESVCHGKPSKTSSKFAIIICACICCSVFCSFFFFKGPK